MITVKEENTSAIEEIADEQEENSSTEASNTISIRCTLVIITTAKADRSQLTFYGKPFIE